MQKTTTVLSLMKAPEIHDSIQMRGYAHSKITDKKRFFPCATPVPNSPSTIVHDGTSSLPE